MIFVTVGTHQQSFVRLTDSLRFLPADELVVQHGHSPAPSEVKRTAPFYPFDEMTKLFVSAKVVVTHAGVGSILSCLRSGHTPVVVPRLRRFHEHVDDHQVALADALEERGRVIVVRRMEELADAVARAPLARAASFVPRDGRLHSALREALQATRA